MCTTPAVNSSATDTSCSTIQDLRLYTSKGLGSVPKVIIPSVGILVVFFFLRWGADKVVVLGSTWYIVWLRVLLLG